MHRPVSHWNRSSPHAEHNHKNKTSVDSRFCLHRAIGTCWSLSLGKFRHVIICYACRVLSPLGNTHGIIGPLFENMTSSTEQYVHHVLQCNERKTEPQPQATSNRTLVKFGHVILEFCKWPERHTYHNTLHSSWGEVTIALASSSKQPTEAVVLMASMCGTVMHSSSLLKVISHQHFTPLQNGAKSFWCNFTRVVLSPSVL